MSVGKNLACKGRRCDGKTPPEKGGGGTNGVGNLSPGRGRNVMGAALHKRKSWKKREEKSPMKEGRADPGLSKKETNTSLAAKDLAERKRRRGFRAEGKTVRLRGVRGYRRTGLRESLPQRGGGCRGISRFSHHDGFKGKGPPGERGIKGANVLNKGEGGENS